MNRCVLINKLSSFGQWVHTVEKQKRSCKPKITGALRERKKKKKKKKKSAAFPCCLVGICVYLDPNELWNFVVAVVSLAYCLVTFMFLALLYMFEIVVMSLALIWLRWMTLVVKTVRACAVQTVIFTSLFPLTQMPRLYLVST